MRQAIIKYVAYFAGLVLLQVLVLNNMQLSSYLNPYAYVLFLLILPFETPGWLLLLSSFALGLSIDVFPQGVWGNGSALGFHAFASVFIAFLRPMVLRWINPRDDYEPGTLPSASDYGFRWYLIYSGILVGIHHFLLFFLEAMSLWRLPEVLLRTFISLLFTLILLFIWEGFRYRRK